MSEQQPAAPVPQQQQPPVAPKAPEPKPAEKSVDDLLNERIANERQRWEADALAKARKAEEAAAKKKAEEEGKFKELADAAEKRAAEAEAKARAADLREQLRAHLDEHKAELSKAAPVIFKLIDVNAEDASAAIKAAVSEYEKSLPEKPKSVGVPPEPRTPLRGAVAASPVASPRSNGRPALSPITRGF